MEDILLLFNETFFKKNGIITVNSAKYIPNQDSSLFIGSHRHTFNPQKILEYFEPISIFFNSL